MEDYCISDIQERLFFIKEKSQRDKMNTICLFATSKNCFAFSTVKEIIEEIGDTDIIENVANGNFELLLKEIFSKRLWSEGIQNTPSSPTPSPSLT
uniref:Uncharacterized protein n=1 Tax=viral metagenome TaxID=1070528 RepID=A0A6C0IZZ4_9ZZZZ